MIESGKLAQRLSLASKLESMILDAKRARDEMAAKARDLWIELGEINRRRALEWAWINDIQAKHIQKAMSLKATFCVGHK